MPIKLQINPKIKERTVIAVSFLPILYAIITLGAKIWQLDKGLVMSDEAYYLYLLKDMPRSGVTQFFIYFQNIFRGDILSVRLMAFSLNLLGTSVFSYGVYSYFKKELKLTQKNFYLIWSFSFLLLFGGIFSLWICYFTLNQFVVFMAMGLILLSIQRSIKWFTSLGIVLSGFFLGTLFFIMITNTPIILIITVLIYFLSDKTNHFRNCLLLIAGVLLSISAYFLFVDDLFLYINSFKKAFVNAIIANDACANNHSAVNHNVAGIKIWSRETIIYLVKNVFIGVMILYGVTTVFRQRKQYSLYVQFIILILFTWFVYACSVSNFIPEPYRFPSTTPFFIAYLYVLLLIVTEAKNKIESKNVLLFCFVFIIPVFLSLGTDVSLELRAVMYISFYLPVIYIMIKFLNKRWRRVIHVLFILFISVYFCYSMYLYGQDRFAWFEIIYTEQNIPVKSIGINQHVRLDKQKIETLQELKANINKNDHVIFGNSAMWWGYMYLLEAKPVSYNFWIEKDKIIQKLREKAPVNPKTLKYIIDTKRFVQTIDTLFIYDIKNEIKADTIIKKEISSAIIYSFAADRNDQRIPTY